MPHSVSLDRWKTIQPILDTALELDPASRAAYLSERCRGDPELRAAVERLLEAVLAPPAGLPDGGPGAIEALVRLAETEAASTSVGARIGPYRVIGEAGRGGMGVVYLAERADDQYRKRVALKLLHRGVDDPHLVRRFFEERQILATLDHPEIAKLLDGGVTAGGLPWFAMEYVEGEPIDAYCNRRRLPVERRLELFLAVCAAVQYAHRNLVVHRDLKPSNVLVTAEGRVKLLDFGIARLLPRQADGSQPTLTQVGRRALTPAYASPEQIRGEPVAVASDVYSLGVVLYSLLSGRHPYGPHSRPERDIERAVLEETPEPPSSAAGRSAEAAAERSTSTDRLRRRLRGDLDMIVLTALRKEPERRYPGVEALAADLRRHLEGLPVQARSDSWSYRAAKFLGRHVAGVAVVAAMTLLVAGFGVVTALQAARVAAERDRAEQVSAFVTDLLRSPDPYRGRSADITVRQVLDSAVLRIRSQLGGRPVLQADLLAVIGRSYRGLGLLPQARSALDSAIALRRRAGDEGRALAEDEAVLGGVVIDGGGDRAFGDSLARAAVRTGRRVLGRGDTALASVLILASRQLGESGSEAEAESLLVEAIGILDRAPRPDSLTMADALHMLGERRWAAADFPGAETLFAKALRIRREHLGPDHPDVGEVSADLGDVLGHLGKPGAVRYLREGVENQRRSLGPDHHDVVKNEIYLADLLAQQGELEAGESLFRKAVAWGLRFSPGGHEFTAQATFGLARTALLRGDTAAAESLFRQGIGMYRRLLRPEEHYAYAGAQVLLARLRIARRDFTEAESLLVEAREATRRQWGDGSARVRNVDTVLARLYEASGRPAQTTRRHASDAAPDSARRF